MQHHAVSGTSSVRSLDADEGPVVVVVGRRELVAARAFYCEALGGRQLHPAGRGAMSASLWFRVGDAIVETGPAQRGARPRVALGARDPEALAARCWDAGFSVRVREDADGQRTLLSVVDPFGRQIDLIPSSGHEEPAVRAGEEEQR